jgi:dipeptidyl aminopeptidase/acylaminoacyl peptidase
VKRRSLVLCMLVVIMIMVGCSKHNNVKENETKMNSEKITNETIKDKEKKNIEVKELVIKEEGKEIYGKLYYPEDAGKHPAIILSHGYNGANSDFESECKYFAQNGYVAYAYDFCGGSVRSKSSGSSTDMNIFTEKADLLEVLNHIRSLENVNADSIYLMGGSQGGLVTSLVAEESEDLIKGMILYYPALNIPDDWRKNYASVDNIPERVDFWGLTLGKNFFVSIRDFNTFDNIGKFSKDVLTVHGDKDAIVLLSNSERAQKLYKNAELVVLPGEGHGFSPTGAKAARELVLDFMEKHQ